MRKALAATAACLLALALALTVAFVLLRLEDPLAALPRPSGAAAVLETRDERRNGRLLRHVVLDGHEAGRVRLVVSLPEPGPSGRMPVVVILGGLRGGSESVRQVSSVADPGPNALLGFDWPLPEREPSLLDLVLGAPGLRRRFLTVPGEVAALLDWASRQPWADPHRVSLLGFSLGAMAAPACQRLAEERGVPVRWTVLGYGGAPIAAVIAGHPGAGPRPLRAVLGAGAGLLLRPVEPSLHLPALHGRFLVLGGAQDPLIAGPAARRFEDLAPSPRTVIRLEGGHVGVGPGQLRLLARVIEVSRAWLLEEGAIDPPRRPGRAPHLESAP